MCGCRRVYGKYLYFPLNFTVNLTTFKNHPPPSIKKGPPTKGYFSGHGGYKPVILALGRISRGNASSSQAGLNREFKSSLGCKTQLKKKGII
jgi:hypothetical protein